jgi:hypothetical protein
MSTVDVGHWADTLLARYDGRDLIGNALFPITIVGVEVRCDFVPMDRHPVDFLRRYRRPWDCVALGLVSAGWAAPMDSPVRPSAHPDAKRIVQAVVLADDGSVAGRIRMPDGSVVDPGAAPVGRVFDALRRALRRPIAA